MFGKNRLCFWGVVVNRACDIFSMAIGIISRSEFKSTCFVSLKISGCTFLFFINQDVRQNENRISVFLTWNLR